MIPTENESTVLMLLQTQCTRDMMREVCVRGFGGSGGFFVPSTLLVLKRPYILLSLCNFF